MGPNPVFFYLETICNLWFAIVIVIRFIVTPSRAEFVRSPQNIMDVAATLSFILDQVGIDLLS